MLLAAVLWLVAVNSAARAADVPDAQTGGEAVLGTADTLTQYGITWTFAEPVKYGQFVNGDYWVVGPVTVKDVTPGWDGERNGSVVDPPASLEQGYVTKMVFGPTYKEGLRAQFPLKIEGLKSLVSTIALPKQTQGGAYEALDVAAVLTVVASVPPKDAFRPPYVAGDKPIYTTRQLRWDRLPKLAKPEGLALPKLTETLTMQRVWLDHFAAKGNGNSTIHPRANMQPYPGDSGRDASTMAVLVLLDIPERQMLTQRLVQLGIDLYAICLKNGDAWRGYGGFGNGRKWPILFAGLMLGEEKMLKPPATVESSNSRTGTVDKFGEDGHTWYGKPTADYPQGKPLWGNDAPPEMFKKLMAQGIDSGGDKDVRDPDGLLDGPEFGYRRICSVTWVGPALAARIMGAREVWNHPAFFDYVDRWIKEQSAGRDPKHNDYQHAYYCWGSEFMKKMWETYRPKADDLGKPYELKQP
jgi:hypothetical protein